MSAPRPLAIDLFCGLGGWTEGLLAEGYDVIGFDIEQHVYGEHRYPAQLVLQDVLTIHGSQFRDASLIVASPPCQEFSYMAMPWMRAKQIARALRGADVFPDGYKGSRSITQLTALFDACFRIQREACEAAGRFIPLVVENVKGAQPWVGRATWSYGSYFLWGDVPALMPLVHRAQKSNPDGTAHPVGSWFAIEVPGMNWSGSGKPGCKAVAFNDNAVRSTKNAGGSWFNIGSPGQKVVNRNPVHDGVKQGGGWFHDSSPGTLRSHASKSTARKAASARIAKIPFALARHIAHVYYPRSEAVA